MKYNWKKCYLALADAKLTEDIGSEFIFGKKSKEIEMLYNKTLKSLYKLEKRNEYNKAIKLLERIGVSK